MKASNEVMGYAQHKRMDTYNADMEEKGVQESEDEGCGCASSL